MFPFENAATEWFESILWDGHRCCGNGGDFHSGKFAGPVEVDETNVGGKRSNMSVSKRKELANTGRGPVGKTAVVGAKDRETNMVRARVVDSTDRSTLHGFVTGCAAPEAIVYTDVAKAYAGIPFKHESIRHSVAEYIRNKVHTNGVESFWATLKRAHKGNVSQAVSEAS